MPTHAVVAALAALVVYDPDADLEANREAMTAAAADGCGPARSPRPCATVAPAVTAPATGWRSPSTGSASGAASALDAATRLVEHLADDETELVTVLVGAEARGADTERLRDQLGLARPDLELEVHEGRQPLYPYLIGVE